jgi:hypothetical protein
LCSGRKKVPVPEISGFSKTVIAVLINYKTISTCTKKIFKFVLVGK